jgi:adenylate kinase
MLGPPGAGKGTQGYRLSQTWGVPHIASGDLLRRVIETEDSDLARAARVIHEGKMVSDEIASAIVFRELERANGFVLDGYPRNVAQAKTLQTFLAGRGEELDAVLLLQLDEAEIQQRLSGRLTCPNCGESYHLVHEPPAVSGICNRCGTALIVREDDHPDRIHTRLVIYEERTQPLIGFYQEVGLLREIDAIGTEEEVYQRCLAAL